jgi:NAD(P)-dependent dehydrogenase (short-subunit alcohol dehydrogenase family)
MRLRDKVAIVTGSGPNIGEAICRLFAREGAKVAVNHRTAEVAERLAAEIQRTGGVAMPLPGDVGSSADVAGMVDAVLRAYGGIDVLVNNAATTVNKGLLETTEEEFDRCVRVTLKGPYLMSRAAAREMIRLGRRGSIINVGSTSAYRGRMNALAYCAAKGGVVNMTRAMAIDLAPHGIRVNTVSPTKTGSAVGSAGSAERRGVDEIPLGRLGEPIDQAHAVLFLASDEAAFITGADLRVDGGSLATWGFSLARSRGVRRDM